MPKVATPNHIMATIKLQQYCKTETKRKGKPFRPTHLHLIYLINREQYLNRNRLTRLYKALSSLELHAPLLAAYLHDLIGWQYIQAHTQAKSHTYTATAAGKAFLMQSEKAIRAIRIHRNTEIEYRLKWVKKYNARPR